MHDDQLSDFDREHIQQILLGHGDWFNAQLLRLIAKADEDNLERLRDGFPGIVHDFEAWRRGDFRTTP